MSDKILALRNSLWQNGYRPVAVKTNGKAPDGDAWQIRARKNPPEAATLAARSWAASTGILCDGLRAIDIDIKDTALADEIEAIARDIIGLGPVRGRPDSAKRLILYRAADGEPRKRKVWSKECPHAVEALGFGQQFVAFGKHPDGADYEWRDGMSPLTMARDDLPAIAEDELTAFMDAAARALGVPNEREREAAKAQPVVVETGHKPAPVNDQSRMARYAADTLARVASDLASMPEGGRNDALNAAAMRLGGMGARGWLDGASARAALMDACSTNGLLKADGAAAFEKTFRSGWQAGLRSPARDPVDREPDDDLGNVVIMLRPRALAVAPSGDIYDQRTGEVLHIQPAPESAADVSGLPDSLTYPGGLLQEVTDWICDTARMPSRPMALAAALVTIGTLAGRRVASPTGAGTHLYVMNLALTGSGKQHPQDCIERLLKAAGKPEYVGPPSFMSMSAVVRLLQRAPVSVCCQDEFGSFLKRVNSKRASSHERGISEVLRTLWGKSFTPYRTPEWASCASVEVGSTALSILGSSTPDDLLGALSGEDVSNGFLNRFLVIDAGGRPEGREPLVDGRDVPASMARALARIPVGGRYQVLGVGNDPAPDMAAWGSAEAQAMFADLERECVAKIDAGPDGAYYARTAEIAVRLATIAAIGHDPVRVTVTAELMAWGREVALGCAAWIAQEAERRMTEELSAAALEYKIRERLRRGPVAMRDLHKTLYRHVRNADDLKRVLAAMEASGVATSYKIDTGGRPKQVFALAS